MRGRRRLVALAAIVVAFAALSLGLAQNWGWSTPFALPGVISYHGRNYSIERSDPTGRAGRAYCFTPSPAASVPGRIYRLPKGYTPLRRVGQVFGYFTKSNPILLPHYEWTYRKAYVVLVRDGGCLRYYSLPGSG